MLSAPWEVLPIVAVALGAVVVLGSRLLRQSTSSRGALGRKRTVESNRAARDSIATGQSPGTIGSREPVALPIRRLAYSLEDILPVETSESGRELAFLYVRDGPQAGHPVLLGPRVTRIGRDRRWADHVVDDDTVSAIHLSIRYKNGAFVLTDLDSENGTIVNGKRVFRHQLARRDEIVIGRTTFIFMRLPAPDIGGEQLNR
jgi:hypothetical protein